MKKSRVQSLIHGFLKTLRYPRKIPERKVIIVPYGPSGVGKTTVMSYLARRIPVVHVQNDAIRLFLRKKKLDENIALYRHRLLQQAGTLLLKQGYSVILDANFATRHNRISQVKRLAKQYGAGLFVVRIKAPKSFVARKLQRKKWLSLDTGGLLPDAKTALEHFVRSSSQYDYEALMPQTSCVVDASKPIAKQVRRLINVLAGKNV